MAPRGRTRRKTGLTRADAARDAMRAYGFETRLINKTLKELLRVYGEEGWILIEEASYKVLLDAILERVEEQQKAERQDQEQVEQTEDGRGLMDSNSTPSVDVEPDTNPNQDTGIGTQAYQADASSFTNCVAVSSPPEGPQEQPPEGLPVHHSEGGAVVAPDAVEMAKETENAKENAEVDGHISPGDSIPINKISETHNGWISSEEEGEDVDNNDEDEDEDEDAYVVLTPEPLCEDLHRLLVEASGQRKRKTRWDVSPEEVNLMGPSAPASTINSDA